VARPQLLLRQLRHLLLRVHAQHGEVAGRGCTARVGARLPSTQQPVCRTKGLEVTAAV
jgi:hypothetical protein